MVIGSSSAQPTYSMISNSQFSGSAQATRTPCVESTTPLSPELAQKHHAPPSGLSARVQISLETVKRLLDASNGTSKISTEASARKSAQNLRTARTGSTRPVDPKLASKTDSKPSGLSARVQIALEGLSTNLPPQIGTFQDALHSIGMGRALTPDGSERRLSVFRPVVRISPLSVCCAPIGEALKQLSMRQLQ